MGSGGHVSEEWGSRGVVDMRGGGMSEELQNTRM